MTVRWKPLPTLALVVGALYCLFPVVWVAIAATKTRAELFSTTAFLPSFNGGLWDNLGDLFAYQDGQFWRWALNSVIVTGPALRRYDFSIVKRIPLAGNAKLEFRAELLNAFNTPWFEAVTGASNNTYTNPNNFRVTDADSGREIQLVFRINW